MNESWSPCPGLGHWGWGVWGGDLRILTTLNPERGLWVDRGEGEKKVQCWEREVNCGEGEGNRRKRKEGRREELEIPCTDGSHTSQSLSS